MTDRGMERSRRRVGGARCGRLSFCRRLGWPGQAPHSPYPEQEEAGGWSLEVALEPGCLPVSFFRKTCVMEGAILSMKEPFLERNTGEREERRRREKKERAFLSPILKGPIHSWTMFIKLKSPTFIFFYNRHVYYY